MTRQKLNCHEKALAINLDANKYGTIAEIGAGQEVARWFFKVGGAAGTVAKTISAYDMSVSDEVYGPARPFVSRARLLDMLDYEYQLVVDRLVDKREPTMQFFAFADTVTARSYTRPDADAHGWMGIRFQHRPRADPSEILLHVRLLDRDNLQQQEALGILGVNMIYGGFQLHADQHLLLESLSDSLTRDRIELDLVRLDGAAFRGVDNRLIALQLVADGLADAAMFTPDGEIQQPSEVLHEKSVLVERGSFRPITRSTRDMLTCARRAFVTHQRVDHDPVVVAEMTLKSLKKDDVINYRDYLGRVEMLGQLGTTVLITNYLRYFRLAAYLYRNTHRPIGIALGVPSLREIFEEAHYEDLDGGILEALGRLFKPDLRMYVYPECDPDTSEITTVSNVGVAPHLQHLYRHLLENGFLHSLDGYRQDHSNVFPRDVLPKIQSGDHAWEDMVPPEVAQIIKERRLFGYA